MYSINHVTLTDRHSFIIPACPESFLKKDSRRALLAGMTRFVGFMSRV